MSIVTLPSGLEIDHAAIADACRRFGVRRLELFGSALTEAFDPGRSDIDLIVTFQSDAWQGRSDRYFGLLDELETVLGRPVDLLTDKAVRNPYLKAAIAQSCRSLFPKP